MRFLPRALALALAVAALPACDSTADNALEGVYTASISDADGLTIITITIDEAVESGAFDVSGTATTDGIAVSFSGTGTYNPPNVSMTVTLFGETDTIEGTVSDDGSTITIDDPDDPFVFRRVE